MTEQMIDTSGASGRDTSPAARMEGSAAAFWTQAHRQLQGRPSGGLNIAHEAVDRHAAGPRREHIALRWLDRAAHAHDYSYATLSALSSRFASLLHGLGVDKGERVCTVLGRVPELYITALGTLKHGSVLCPLFSAFGPEPLHARLSISRARVLVTTAALYRRKVETLRAALPDLAHILIVADQGTADLPGTHDFHALMAAADPAFGTAATYPEDIALLHFTSGTTGRPKGAIHVHAAVVAHHATARAALDLRPDDIFWCTADPGWVTGTSYGIIAPLTIGATLIVDQVELDAERWYRILQDQRVTVWYTAPTAIRMLMKLGVEVARRYDTRSLRFLASAGEALNPAAIAWGQEAFGLPFHDSWWQTETGAIMIANRAGLEIRPGSMGRPLPGVEAAIVQRSEDGLTLITEPDSAGELALRAGWPAMFRGYLGDEERYRECFVNDWYLSGDLARRDRDGYIWFVSRADDAIKSSGHLIGPFEVECVLMEHPAVAEAAAIGKPDAVAGEVVKAFVALRPGYAADDGLRRELLAHARLRLGAVLAPKEIELRPSLPRTRSGKIMRRLLRAQELALPEGDLSTLEPE